MGSESFDLFGERPAGPEGFVYREDVIGPAEERELAERIRVLPLQEFDFHGYLGKRRVISYGWKYDYDRGVAERTDDIPEFLLPLRRRAAAFAGLAENDLQQAHVIEYGSGAGIGWHRDKPQFGDVVGFSLLSPCRFRLRLKTGRTWRRVSLTLFPRSAYLMRGPSRTEWEHSIPPVDRLRYSITFRSLATNQTRRVATR